MGIRQRHFEMLDLLRRVAFDPAKPQSPETEARSADFFLCGKITWSWPLHMHQPHCRGETLATLLAQTPEKQKHETGKPANRQTAKSRDRSAHRRFFFMRKKKLVHV